jgi:hypothetical protein
MLLRALSALFVAQAQRRHHRIFHTVMAATLVAPGHGRVVPLEPAFVVPQDGHDKQVREHVGAALARCPRPELRKA